MLHCAKADIICFTVELRLYSLHHPPLQTTTRATTIYLLQNNFKTEFTRTSNKSLYLPLNPNLPCSLIPPGSGPSESARLSGHWRHELVAITEGPQPLVLHGQCGVRGEAWQGMHHGNSPSSNMHVNLCYTHHACDKTWSSTQVGCCCMCQAHPYVCCTG